MTDDLARYQRQTLLPCIGQAGQRQLACSTAVVLGCGALGSVSSEQLVRAGVGHIVIIDRDVVELTNLQRQVLFDEDDAAAGAPKSEAAKRKLARINSNVEVTAVVDDINHTNIERFVAAADVLIDGLDNFETRYLANDIAVKRQIPYIYGGAVGTAGMMFPIVPDSAAPCFRCLFQQAPPPGATASCDTAGVLNSITGLVASLQVTEALKVLTGQQDAVNRRLLTLDPWNNEFLQLKVAHKSTDCVCCGQRDFEYLDGRVGSNAAFLCGQNAVQVRRIDVSAELDFAALQSRLQEHGPVTTNEFILRADLKDNGNAFAITLFRNGRAIVKGTSDPAVARGIYAKYIGA